jgi:hypothetical protein
LISGWPSSLEEKCDLIAGNSLLPNFKCLADDVVAVVLDKATVAVEHRQLILVEPDGNLLLGWFDALRYGRKPLFVLLVQPLQKSLACRTRTDLTSLKGGSYPRSEDTSDAGLWRLDRPQTGVAPALFMTPRAALRRPRLLVEVVFSPLVTDDNRRTVPRTASRTKPTIGMVR